MKKEIIIPAAIALIGMLTLSPAMAGDTTHSKKGDESHMGEQMDTNRHQYFSKNAMRGTDLIGQGVYNRNNEEIGSVEDLVIGSDGQVNYLVIEYGGILGMGDRLVPIPMSKIDRSRTEDSNIRINVSKEELDNAPNFTTNEWPNFNDDGYQDELRGYYGEESPASTPEYDKKDKMESGEMRMQDTGKQSDSQSKKE